MDTYFINHIADLSNKAYSTGVTAFSLFLTPEEQNEIISHKKELIPFELFGGNESCERKMARLGDKNSCDVVLPFPLTVIKAEPLNKKFSDKLTHRDFLGAIMNLGIDRENTGDIIVRENTAYIFVLKPMAEFICDNLTKVKHTSIKCSECESLPEGELFKTQNKTVIVSSMRIDCIICGVYNLSRSKCDLLFKEKKVFTDSKLTEATSDIIREGAVISLRGFGKFRVSSVTGSTKKGRIVLEIAQFI